MSPGPQRPRRGKRLLSALLVPVMLAGVGQLRSTSALLGDARSTVPNFQASVAGPPQVTPAVLEIQVHVGDRCEDAPALTVQNPSGWTQHLAVTASGWLEESDVYVDPTTIGPGQSATVYFTKAAVLGPMVITGEIVVTADPGSHITVVPLQGEVTEPADASDPPPSPYPGCESTPRTASEEESETAAADEAEAPEAEAEAQEAEEQSMETGGIQP